MFVFSDVLSDVLPLILLMLGQIKISSSTGMPGTRKVGLRTHSLVSLLCLLQCISQVLAPTSKLSYDTIPH